MVTLLFTAILVVGLLAITLYLWMPRAKCTEQNLLLPPDPPRGLFSEEDGFESAVLSPQPDPNENKAQRFSLIARAKSGDKSALVDASTIADHALYLEVLTQLLAQANRDATLLALISFVTRNELTVSSELASAFIKSWKVSPNRSSTATALHLAALADDAALYQGVVETAVEFWSQGLLADVSAPELRALFEGEFWVLSERTRSSGAGFLVKRTLANARRELETARRIK
jgi:hypothetical protein